MTALYRWLDTGSGDRSCTMTLTPTLHLTTEQIATTNVKVPNLAAQTASWKISVVPLSPTQLGKLSTVTRKLRQAADLTLHVYDETGKHAECGVKGPFGEDNVSSVQLDGLGKIFLVRVFANDVKNQEYLLNIDQIRLENDGSQ